MFFKLTLVLTIIGCSLGLPIKDEDIDELIYRLQDLRHQSNYEGNNLHSEIAQVPYDNSPIAEISTRSLDSIGGAYLLRSIRPSLSSLSSSSSLPSPRYQTPYFNGYNNENPRYMAHHYRQLQPKSSSPLESLNDSYFTIPHLSIDFDEDNRRHLQNNDVDVERRSLDSIGGANLLKRSDNFDVERRSLDSIGGANLLKRSDNFDVERRSLDSIGGANLLKRSDNFDVERRSLDSIGGANLLKRSNFDVERRSLDSIGGANLLKRNNLDVERRSLDSIGGANLLKRSNNYDVQRRSLDSLGGANLLKRNLDSIGGAHLLKRSVDPLGGAFLLKKK